MDSFRQKVLIQSLFFLSIVLILELMPNGFLPSPLEIFSTFLTQIQSERIITNLWHTATRVYLASFMALVLGVIIGIIDYFDPRVSYITNAIFYPTQFVSEAVLAILAIAALGLNPAVVYIITVLGIVPDVFIATQVGMNHLDERLLELGDIYGKSKLTTLRHLIIPQVIPYIFTGLIRAHASAWEIVGTVEVFLALNGLGYLVQNQFRLLNLPELFGLATVIIVSGLISDRVLRTFKTRIDRKYKNENDKDRRSL